MIKVSFIDFFKSENSGAVLSDPLVNNPRKSDGRPTVLTLQILDVMKWYRRNVRVEVSGTAQNISFIFAAQDWVGDVSKIENESLQAIISHYRHFPILVVY